MQKADTDYSNTLFYKIFCKDISITDVYIGHTTNFVQRKSGHKQSCVNPKSSNYKLKLYNVIRENGGWTNWQMDIIAYHHCKDQYEARTKEQEYFILYNATLNSIEPMPRPKCEKQIIAPSVKKNDVPSNDIGQVYQIARYNAPEAVIQLSQKSDNSVQCPSSLCKNTNSKKYICEKCEFGCNKKRDYARHVSTAKHQFVDNCMKTNTCICGNTYKHLSGLCRHKTNCNFIKSSLANSNVKLSIAQPLQPIVDTTLILELLKQNQEFKDIMIEQNKHMMELVKNSGHN
jgi:hypothetical protein